jgi:hypothetical protein
MYLFGNLISWFSKVQSTTAKTSSMESELIAANASADETSWLFHLMNSIKIVFEHDIKPIPMMMDNVAALSVSNHLRQNAKSKHMNLREFRIQDYAENQVVHAYWIPGKLNPADVFTKLLSTTSFNQILPTINIQVENNKYKEKQIKDQNYPTYGQETEKAMTIEEKFESYSIHDFIPEDLLICSHE